MTTASPAYDPTWTPDQVPGTRPLVLDNLVKPEEIQAMFQTSMRSSMSKAVEEATAELAQAMISEQIQHQFAPAVRDWMTNAQYGRHLSKADQQDRETAKLAQNMQPQDPKALLYDPFTALDQLGFRERPTAVTYRTLAEMARRVPPYSAILQTRINQMASFADPQPDEHSIGCKIKLRDRRMEMTPDLERRADELMRWVVNCGNPDVRVKRDRFGNFIRKGIWDALVYDQLNAEIVPDRTGRPSYWRIVDASTIRITDDLDETDDDFDSIQTVQVYDNTIIAEFTDAEMLFGIRNPRSDIRYAGYGQSELEMLIVIITAILWGIDYNAKFFKQGTVAKGLINFKGAIPDRELSAFRRQWYELISGVQNAWRTPVVNSDEVQWINMQNSNRDMEFGQWLDWLLKVTCGVMQIAPEEIGFQFGNGGQTSSMSEGSQEDKLKYSKDKGLVPLAKFLTEEMNEKVLRPLDDRFILEFAGLNARSAEQLIELQTKETSSLKTIDEARAERGLPPMPNGEGAIIRDPVWLQNKQGAQMDGGGGGPLDTDGLDPGDDDDGNGDEKDDPNEDGFEPHKDDVDNEDDGDEQVKHPEFDKSGWRAQLGSKILNLESDR